MNETELNETVYLHCLFVTCLQSEINNHQQQCYLSDVTEISSTLNSTLKKVFVFFLKKGSKHKILFMNTKVFQTFIIHRMLMI